MPFLTEAPDELYRIGLLATIFMGHNSDSHLPPYRDLLDTLTYPKHLQQCLKHRKYSINICWFDDPGMETNRGIPPVSEASSITCGLWSCGQHHPIMETEEQGMVETKETWREIWRARTWASSHRLSVFCSQAFPRPSCKPLTLSIFLCLLFNFLTKGNIENLEVDWQKSRCD